MRRQPLSRGRSTPVNGTAATAQLKPRRPPRRLIRSRAIRKAPEPRTPESSAEKLPYTLKSVVDLKLRGWSEREIGAYFGLTGPAIHAKLKGLGRLLDHESLEAYRDNKVAFLTAVEVELLKLLLDREKQAKATLGNVAYAFTQFHQAGRLEQGRSTSNFAIHEIVEELARDAAAEAKRKRESAPEAEEAATRRQVPAGEGPEDQEAAGP